MANPRAFRAHAQLKLDAAISDAFVGLRGNTSATAAFTHLLAVSRAQSTFLEPRRAFRARFAQVACLRNLARYCDRWRRSPETWSAPEGSLYPTTASLAEHLFADYPMPVFLATVWLGESSASKDKWRSQYIAHGSGRRFRDLNPLLPMTRHMESIFLRSPDHMRVTAALRRAELIALGAGPALVRAVLATRLAYDFSNPTFWRTVMRFVAEHQAQLAPDMVGPIVDYIQFVRHEYLEVHTTTGVELIAPPQPDFSIKGRTPQSVLRLVEAWHKALGTAPNRSRSWRGSGFRPLRIQERPRTDEHAEIIWEFQELTNSAQLRAEGAALSHCVAAYSWYCLRGRSRIWSLRRRVGSGKARPVLTIEVNPLKRMVVQARGFKNRAAKGRVLELLTRWCEECGLGLRL